MVDVEGSELRLLGTELPSPRPRLVMYEHKHLQPLVKQKINSSLEMQGYRFVGGVAGGVGGVDKGRGHGDVLWRHAAVAERAQRASQTRQRRPW